MGYENGKLKLVCSNVQRIKEHGVESNIVVLSSRDKEHDILRLEEFATTSNFSVGREYEVSISPVCNG